MFGIKNSIWNEFDRVLSEAGQISFWWRDDDVRASKPKFCKSNFKFDSRLKNTLSLLQEYHISGVFAIIPDKFPENGAKQADMLKRFEMPVTLHGLKHENNNSDGHKCEFPDSCDNEKALADILAYQAEFEKIFGRLLLPVFVPPYNSINAVLEQKLLDNGFRLVSKRNADGNTNPYDVDIDFMNWQTYKMRSARDILTDIIGLIKQGQKVIGFNNHHRCISRFDRRFFRKLFKVLASHDNVKWIMPL